MDVNAEVGIELQARLEGINDPLQPVEDRGLVGGENVDLPWLGVGCPVDMRLAVVLNRAASLEPVYHIGKSGIVLREMMEDLAFSVERLERGVDGLRNVAH